MLKNKRIISFETILTIGIFAVSFLACCMIKYSDGDDAFFLKTISEHPNFLDFTTHLTRTMNGRIAATSTLWLIFSNSIWLWRILNAAVITLFTVVLSYISKIVINADKANYKMLLFFAASLGISGIGIVGYSCLWITGSVNYLWPCVAGLCSLLPFIKSVFDENYKINLPAFLFSAVTGIYTCLAQEQIGAVVICSTLIIIFYTKAKTKKFNIFQIIPFFLMLAAFILLIMSPANANRGDKEILRWLPEYAQFTFFDKLFTTSQWLLHSVANSLKYVFVLIWVWLAVNFHKDNKKILSVICVLMILVSLLSVAGINAITDLGLNNIDMTKKIDNAPRFEDLNSTQIVVAIWWIICIIITGVFSYIANGNRKLKIFRLLTYLAGIASAAIMFFSPTIYASGERTLFVMSSLLTLLASTFVCFNSPKKSAAVALIASLIVIAGLQLFENIDFILKMI